MNYKTHLPPGVQDYLPEECAHKRRIEEKARRCLASWGYEEVETPCLEYIEVFQGGIGGFEPERVFKLTDGTGRILALRPDITMPLARLAATRLAGRQPLRMFYVGNAFQFYRAESSAGMREFTQIGGELMGETGPMADAEVIALAVSILRESGLKDFQVEIGQVRFFKGLMQEAGLTNSQAEEVRRHVEDKNMLAIELMMQQAGVSGSLRNRILELPTLYGGPEVLTTAERITSGSSCRAALDTMKRTLDVLSSYGLDEFVSVDLGMVQSISYYSGIIFRGISRHFGNPLLAGGRYDGLVGEFGRPMAATGFAFSVKPVLIALERQGGLACESGVGAVACFAEADGPYPMRALQGLRDTGIRVEPFYGETDGLISYAESRGACSALLWSDGGFIEVWRRGGGL